jgi:hypothetical protein
MWIIRVKRNKSDSLGQSMLYGPFDTSDDAAAHGLKYKDVADEITLEFVNDITDMGTTVQVGEI